MLLAAIKKDFLLLLRNRGELLSLFLLPLIFMGAFGAMFGSGGNADRPRVVALYHPPGLALGEQVAAAIDAAPAFRVQRAASPAEVDELVAADEADVGLVLPPDFQPLAGRPGTLVIDQAAPIQVRGPLEGALGAIVGRVLTGGGGQLFEVRSPPGKRAPLAGVSGFQVSVPGNAVLFGFFIALTVALSFNEERRTGTWRRLLAAPVGRPTLLTAKLFPYFLIGLVQMGFLFGLGILAFDLRVPGSWLALVVLSVAVIFAATTLGLLIASFGGTEKQVGGVGSVSLLVMGLLGGAMIPRLVMPEAMRTLGLATPHGWALDGYYDLLIREGTSLADVALPIAAVVGFGVIFGAVGLALFRFERGAS